MYLMVRLPAMFFLGLASIGGVRGLRGGQRSDLRLPSST